MDGEAKFWDREIITIIKISIVRDKNLLEHSSQILCMHFQGQYLL